jgi:hypothetical protein
VCVCDTQTIHTHTHTHTHTHWQAADSGEYNDANEVDRTTMEGHVTQVGDRCVCVCLFNMEGIYV